MKLEFVAKTQFLYAKILVQVCENTRTSLRPLSLIFYAQVSSNSKTYPKCT